MHVEHGYDRNREGILQMIDFWKVLFLAHLGKYGHCVDGNPDEHVLFFLGNILHNWI